MISLWAQHSEVDETKTIGFYREPSTSQSLTWREAGWSAQSVIHLVLLTDCSLHTPSGHFVFPVYFSNKQKPYASYIVSSWFGLAISPLMSIKDRSTLCRATGLCLRPHNLVRTHSPREGRVYTSFTRSYLWSMVIWEHVGKCSVEVTLIGLQTFTSKHTPVSRKIPIFWYTHDKHHKVNSTTTWINVSIRILSESHKD